MWREATFPFCGHLKLIDKNILQYIFYHSCLIIEKAALYPQVKFAKLAFVWPMTHGSGPCFLLYWCKCKLAHWMTMQAHDLLSKQKYERVIRHICTVWQKKMYLFIYLYSITFTVLYSYVFFILMDLVFKGTVWFHSPLSSTKKVKRYLWPF